MKITPLDNVTRIEVIGDGREYVTYDRKIEGWSIQDGGLTLKLFLKPREE